jgi:hypothetical protein
VKGAFWEKKRGGGGIIPPLKYPPIFTFASKVSSVTLNLPKLSNHGNLIHLAFLFPKCPHYIFFFLKKKKKKKSKTNKKRPNMASHLVWPSGGSATPRLAIWGGRATPSGPWGGLVALA